MSIETIRLIRDGERGGKGVWGGGGGSDARSVRRHSRFKRHAQRLARSSHVRDHGPCTSPQRGDYSRPSLRQKGRKMAATRGRQPSPVADRAQTGRQRALASRAMHILSGISPALGREYRTGPGINPVTSIIPGRWQIAFIPFILAVLFVLTAALEWK